MSAEEGHVMKDTKLKPAGPAFVDLLPLTELQSALAAEHHEYAANVARGVKRRLPRHVDVNDLIAAAYEALLRLVRIYDPEKGIPFRAFAFWRLQGAAWDEARRLFRHEPAAQKKIDFQRASEQAAEAQRYVGPEDGETPEAAFARAVRAQVAVHLVSQYGDPIGDDDEASDPFVTPLSAADAAGDSEADAHRAEVVDRLKGCVMTRLEELDPADRAVVRGVILEGRTLDDVARDLGGIHKANVSRRLQKALARLSALLAQDLRAGDGHWAVQA